MLLDHLPWPPAVIQVALDPQSALDVEAGGEEWDMP